MRPCRGHGRSRAGPHQHQFMGMESSAQEARSHEENPCTVPSRLCLTFCHKGKDRYLLGNLYTEEAGMTTFQGLLDTVPELSLKSGDPNTLTSPHGDWGLERSSGIFSLLMVDTVLLWAHPVVISLPQT